MTNQESTVGKEELEGKLICKSIFFFALIIAVTFSGAGRIDYWQGWIYNGLNIIFLLLSYFLLPRELIEERLKPKEGLALMNGTAVMTAMSIFAYQRAEYLAQLCSRITALATIGLGSNFDHFDEFLFSVKPHHGQANH